jgi:antirestriction protein ArdC
MNIHDLYRTITESIIAELETGAIPWVRPWKGTNIMPTNAATGKRYNGINIPILWYIAEKRGFPHHLWCTYRQACEIGAQVRKGEHAAHIVYTSSYVKMVDETPESTRFLKSYAVFNVAQLDGYELAEEQSSSQIERDARADDVISATSAVIQYGGSDACYIPSQDVIRMPQPDQFRDSGNFYATMFHELGHWSGDTKRLDRDLSGRFGSKAYAAEELIEELCSAFVCAAIGIQGELRHAGYIDSWIKLLRDDDRALFTAASKASQAADFIHPRDAA